MNKKWLILIVCAIFLMGCSTDALSYYQEAAIKTDSLDRAKSTLDLGVDFDFTDLFKTEAGEFTDFLEEISYTSERAFDRKTNEKIVRQYVGNRQIGFDTVFYNDKGLEYIKVPFAGKYLKLETLLQSDLLGDAIYDEPPFEKKTLNRIKQLWLDLVQVEDVVNLGDEVIDTPEGEVKVKKFVVSFSNEQIKTFLKQVTSLIAEDEKFAQMIKEQVSIKIDDSGISTMTTESVDVKQVIEGMDQLLSDVIVDEFEMVTYIDIDQYIIESRYKVQLSFKGELGELIKTLKLDASYMLYDLHETISFVFPSIDETNTSDLETILDNFDLDALDIQ